MRVPSQSEIKWTESGVFVTTVFPDDGPEPRMVGTFVATSPEVLLAYIKELWYAEPGRG